MNPYPIRLEISGPIALWARPDTMPNPVSYVAPTFSAAKGIFEAILRWKSVNVRPTRCEICAPVQFYRYAFNYGGPLRKSDQMRSGSSLQVFAQALINVCYRLHAEVDWNRGPNGESAESPDGQCAQDAYVDALHCLLERGRWFYAACLGCKEFVSDYIGPFHPEKRFCKTEYPELPKMPRMGFEDLPTGLKGDQT